MVLEVRTDWEKEPTGVRCPFCQRKPQYTGSRREGDKAPLPTDNAARSPKDVKGWTQYNNGTVWYVFAVGRPFKPLGHVLCRPDGLWESRLTFDPKMPQPADFRPRDARVEAQEQVEHALSQHGYVILSPSGSI
jgi:hypothetical protein